MFMKSDFLFTVIKWLKSSILSMKIIILCKIMLTTKHQYDKVN